MDPAMPTIGRIVIYRSRTGDYDVPAIITATVDTLNEWGVKRGHVPPLSDEGNVHLTVFTPGRPGMRRGARSMLAESPYPLSENVAGCYQEWDIPHFANELNEHTAPEALAGTWRWPTLR